MLIQARRQASELQSVIAAMTREFDSLKGAIHAPERPQDESAADRKKEFERRILQPNLGHDERRHELSAAPELFVQSRYQTLPIENAEGDAVRPNFSLTRMESRWAGRVADRVGMGFEIQYHPAPAGSAFEIVNDAFVEYYPNQSITIRAGQFVKPFGFDIQHSSSARESPERGIFAGYFFPGQRDRGFMIVSKLDPIASMFRGASIYAGAFNGNRFFQDNNRQLNYNLRARKVFESIPLAAGVSAQLGRQILPSGVTGTTRENAFGMDVQFAWQRFGLRAEYVAGNRPSTLLDITPEFAPAFRPGAHSAGGVISADLQLTPRNDVYWRYDQFTGDPVSGSTVRAFNFGYLRQLAKSRIGIDWQYKNAVSLNDDHVNTRFQISWSVMAP
jgi:hypothetical protein